MPHRANAELTPEQAVKRQIMINRSHLYTLLGLLVIIGMVVGYAGARIETNKTFVEQEARHVTEILRVRDEYGERAKDTRETVKRAAESTSEAAQALKDMAAELGPEQTRAARRATEAAKRAEKAADTAKTAEERVDRVMRLPDPPRHDYRRKDVDPKSSQLYGP